MSDKKRIAIALAHASGMELNVEGTCLWATPDNASLLISKVAGKLIKPSLAREMCLSAGWDDYQGELYGTMDALINLMDAAWGMEV